MSRTSPKPVWAVVMPVFEDGASFEAICRDLAALDCSVTLEVVAVDDGSVREPPSIEALRTAGLTGRIVRLRRNVGHQMAIAVGLDHVRNAERYSGAVVMDSDGEDRVTDIPNLIETTDAEDCDVAVATRARRSESIVFRVFYQVYRQFFRWLTGRVITFGNFMAIKREAVSRLTAMHEIWVHVAAAVMKSRLRWKDIPLDRGYRYAGQSRMNFFGLALHGIRAVTVFDDAVMTRMAIVSAFSAIACGGVIAAALGLKLFGHATPGWVTTVVGLMILVFLQTGVLTLIALIMNGLSFRSPRVISADAESMILRVEASNPVVLVTDPIPASEISASTS